MFRNQQAMNQWNVVRFGGKKERWKAGSAHDTGAAVKFYEAWKAGGGAIYEITAQLLGTAAAKVNKDEMGNFKTIEKLLWIIIIMQYKQLE